MPPLTFSLIADSEAFFKNATSSEQHSWLVLTRQAALLLLRSVAGCVRHLHQSRRTMDGYGAGHGEQTALCLSSTAHLH